MQLAMQAVLCSPKFLFRAELDDRPDSPDVRPLDEFQLASRLSYFLWSTMPDEALTELAAKNQLRANLDAQVNRMLQDPKSESLVENFALQWLQLKRLDSFAPDPQRFPQFSSRLRASMLEETKRFFASVMREDRSIVDLLDADYTFLNERLARHYGIVDTQGTRAGQKPVSARRATDSGRRFCSRRLGRQRARRIIDASQRVDSHLQPDTHVARKTRPLGAGADPRHAPAAASAERALAAGGRAGRVDRFAAATL